MTARAAALREGGRPDQQKILGDAYLEPDEVKSIVQAYAEASSGDVTIEDALAVVQEVQRWAVHEEILFHMRDTKRPAESRWRLRGTADALEVVRGDGSVLDASSTFTAADEVAVRTVVEKALRKASMQVRLAAGWDPVEDAVAKITRLLEDTRGPLSRNAIEQAIRGKRETVRDACDRLLRDGRAEELAGPRNARLMVLVQARSPRQTPEIARPRPDLAPPLPEPNPSTPSAPGNRRGEVDHHNTPSEHQESVGFHAG